ncbi:DNA polymerase III subunit delta [Candidatus Uhrbacteria bacterium]|nr:DNA polymerase III subunit delta [Candidatus Uhrbacteria bacterium]
MVILIYGEDAFRIKEKISGMTDKFKEKFDPSGMNLDVFEFSSSASSGNMGDIMSALGAPPFLAERRMIVVKGLAHATTKKADAEAWSAKLLGRGDETIIILADSEVTVERSAKNKLYAVLRLGSDVHEYPLGVMTDREASLWVQAKSSATLNADALREIVIRAGADTWRLKNEVDKVSTAVDGGTVTRETVIKLVQPTFDDSLFAFLDAVRAHDGRKAVGLLRNEVDRGTSPGQLINMLMREVQLLTELRAYAAVNGRGSERNAARELGIHPFVAKKTMPRALAMPSDELKGMIASVLTADERLKNGSMKDVSVLEQLVVDLVA